MAGPDSTSSSATLLHDDRAPQCENDTTTMVTQITINRGERDELRDHLSALAERGLDGVSRIAQAGHFHPSGVDEYWLELCRRDIGWAFAVLDELSGDAESYSLTVRPQLVALVERDDELGSLRAKLHGTDSLPTVYVSGIERQVLREVAADLVRAWAADLALYVRDELRRDDAAALYLEELKAHSRTDAKLQGALAFLDALGWERNGDEAREGVRLRGTPQVIAFLREERDGTDCGVVEATCAAVHERLENAGDA